MRGTHSALERIIFARDEAASSALRALTNGPVIVCCQDKYIFRVSSNSAQMRNVSVNLRVLFCKYRRGNLRKGKEKEEVESRGNGEK
jgi:hypothetical protein